MDDAVVTEKAEHRRPFFSVVIPTKNRKAMLHKCLESLSRLDYPEELREVIVVNDGGKLAIEDIDETLQAALALRLFTLPPGGPAKARNFGALNAKGDYVTFIDDDCTVHPGLLREYARGFLETGFDALGGRSVNPHPEFAGNRAWHHLVELLNKHMKDAGGNNIVLISNNVSYLRSTFLELGGFNETFRIAAAEDRELSMRLLSVGKGYRQAYWPDAVVWHHIQLRTAMSYLPVQFRYGRGTHHFSRFYATSRRRNKVYKESPGINLYGTYLWKQVADDKARVSMVLTIYLGLLAHRLGRTYESLRSKLGK